MTTCAACGTTQGPFVGDGGTPGIRVCGFPPRLAREGNTTVGQRSGAAFTARQERVIECLARRNALDNVQKEGRTTP